LDELLCFAVHATGFAFTRVYRRPLQRLGLTYPQYLVLVALWGEDRVTVGRLAERLCLDTSTLTPLLKRLEGLKLLTRTRGSSDERRVTVTLSEQGWAMQQQAACVTRWIVESSGLSAEDLARLTRELRTLRGNLVGAAANAPLAVPQASFVHDAAAHDSAADDTAAHDTTN
jgi:DNA-binding MarR family transcriptional regulator